MAKCEKEQHKSWTATIGELPPLDPKVLSGEEAVEITTSTCTDPGPEGAPRSRRISLDDLLSLYAKRRDNPNHVTAEQVGSLTEKQIRDLLEEKLDAGAVAKDSEKLGGKNASEYLLVVEHQQTLINLTSGIDEITDSLLAAK